MSPRHPASLDPQQWVPHTSDLVSRSLESAARLTLSIIAVQGVKRDTGILQRLALFASTVVCAILHHYATADDRITGTHQDLLNGSQELVRILISIEHFVEKRTSQNAFVRMVQLPFDRKEIRGYRKNLERILGVFGLRSSVLIPQNLEQIASQLEMTLEELVSRKRGENQAFLLRESHDKASTSVTYTSNHSSSFPGHIQQIQEEWFAQTTAGGNQTIIHAASHVSHTNSGNNTTTITTNSNNRVTPTHRGVHRATPHISPSTFSLALE